MTCYVCQVTFQKECPEYQIYKIKSILRGFEKNLSMGKERSFKARDHQPFKCIFQLKYALPSTSQGGTVQKPDLYPSMKLALM